MMLAAGQPPKVISEMLGHATVAFITDVCTEVVEELASSAADAIAAYVPAGARSPGDGARDVPAGGGNER